MTGLRTDIENTLGPSWLLVPAAAVFFTVFLWLTVRALRRGEAAGAASGALLTAGWLGLSSPVALGPLLGHSRDYDQALQGLHAVEWCVLAGFALMTAGVTVSTWDGYRRRRGRPSPSGPVRPQSTPGEIWPPPPRPPTS